MYDRIAWIWFSCFCCASENFRSKPFSLVSVSWMDLVLAARQPLSEPTWEKPTVMASPLPLPPDADSEPELAGVAVSSLALLQADRPRASTAMPAAKARVVFFLLTMLLL